MCRASALWSERVQELQERFEKIYIGKLNTVISNDQTHKALKHLMETLRWTQDPLERFLDMSHWTETSE